MMSSLIGATRSKVLILVLALFPALSFGAEPAAEQDGPAGTPAADEKQWMLQVSAGLQYDSNVILNPENSPLPEGISRKSGWRTIAFLKSGYEFLSTEEFSASAGYSLYQSLQKDLSSYRVTKHALGLDAVYELGWASLKGSYDFDYALAGGDKYSSSHSLSPSLEISGDRFFGDLHYEFSRDRFTDSPRFPANSERTGRDNTAGMSLGMNISESFSAMLAYDHNTTSARVEHWEYDGDKVSLTLLARFSESASALLSGWLQKADYDGFYPSTVTARKDTTKGQSLSLKKDLSDAIGVTAGAAHTRNDSNINAVDYKRTVYSLILTARF